MKRILYLTDSLMVGGTEQQLVELVTRLDRQRFDPYIVCLYGTRAKRSLHFLDRLRALNIPVSVLDLGWSTRDKMAGIGGIIREVWRVRPHVIQAVNYHSNFLLRLARPFLPRFIALVGCIYVDYTPKQLRYERLSNWVCSVVVCNSPHLQDSLKRCAPHCCMKLIPNGIDLERYSADATPLFSHSTPDDPQYVLLMMGRIAPQKAPDLLIEALGILKQRGDLPCGVRVRIVGESEYKATQAQLDAAIEHYELRDIVLQYPATEKPEDFYRAADIVLVPSLCEGLPSVALEALAAGRPVIISEAANRAGLIGHGIHGWVVRTGEVEHLAEVLCRVFLLPSSVLEDMYAECQKAAEDFSVYKMVQQYEMLYESLNTRS